MTERNVFENLVDGDTPNQGYFNGLFRLLGSDNGSQAWDNTDTTYTELSTVDLTAITTTCDKILIVIDVQVNAFAVDVGPVSSTPAIEIQVGESGSEAQVKEWAAILKVEDSNIETRAEIYAAQTLFYIHELTAGEKANGFNVIVNGKYVLNGGGSTVDSTHHQTIVVGIGP